MSTIADVAKHAGVSKMTVSRVINDSGYISQETRERVEQAIEELGYIPNALARSLRFKRTRTIALILTDITNPYFTTLARGVEDAASEQGFSVIFCNTDESAEEEAEYINVLLQKQIDGLLLVPAQCSSELLGPLQGHALPFVILDRRITDIQVDTVRCDSEQGAYELTRHLIELGHRQLAILSGPETVTSATDRVDGFQRAIKEAGLDVEAAHVRYGRFTVDDGFRMTQEVMAAAPPPTGLFAGNNFIAIGALRALRQAGLRIPEDVSLVAFDDIPISIASEPFLTVAEQPAYELGWQATRLLLDRLSEKDADTPTEIILPTRLIIRESSGPNICHRVVNNVP